MKTKHIFLAAFMLLLFHLSSSLNFAQEGGAFCSFSYEGNMYTYEIDGADLVNTPSWNPERESAPLSSRKAVEIARRNLRRLIKRDDIWEVDEIRLEEMGAKKWVYDIGFSCRGNGCREGVEEGFCILIKMDGTTIEPRIENRQQSRVTAKPNNSFNPTALSVPFINLVWCFVAWM